MEGGGSVELRCLCLNCRGVGHVMAKCPKNIVGDELGWFFSLERKLLKASTNPNQQPCKRCETLDLIELLQNPSIGNTLQEFKDSSGEARQHVRSLGPAGSAIFLEDCPVCRCLFVISPSPAEASQEILLFVDSTAHRVAAHNTIDPEGSNPYAKSLLVVMWPSWYGDNADGHRGDGLCIIEESEERNQKDQRIHFRLGGRALDPREYSLDILKGWLNRCDRLHPATCQPVWVEKLKDISLLDVYTRQVTKYPEIRVDYVALSYVWGDVQQKQVKRGTTLTELPQTIEDAILFVIALGKQYLWIDSLCIDQGSDEDKRYQIALMCSIYQGAYATIVALSGESANSGLPRANPEVPTYDQHSCVINGKELVTIMPTLSQTIFLSAWGSRAWTFQEALLSPRCFYLSEHQVFFECNAMTCCETLNETRSHVHNLYWNEKFVEEEHPEDKYGLGVLRNPFVGESRKPERLQEYGNLLALYQYRSMTDDSDAINAFSGILQALTQDLYTKGFYWGLPIEHFNFGLLWTCRSNARRRVGFPSWSWGAWKGPVWAVVPEDGVSEKDVLLQPFLRISKVDNGEVELLFETNSGREEVIASDESAKDNLLVDPIAKKNLVFHAESKPNITENLITEYPGLLYIEGIILRFLPQKRDPSTDESGQEYRWISTTLRGQNFQLLYTYSGHELESRLGTNQDFLLLARESCSCCSNYIIYRVLMIDIDDDQKVATRIAPMKLWIVRNEMAVIQDAKPVVRTILLA